MSDLISRKEAWKAFDECNLFVNREDRDIAQEVIENLPPVEAKPVVHGEWLYERETYNTCSAWKCSNCGECYGLPFIKDEYNFCPECGADMRGGKNE